MQKKINPTITYIKKGVEKTVTLNWWNHWFILNSICELDKLVGIDKKFLIKRDIEWLQMKNFVFEEIENIICQNTETVCIFNRCQFKLEKWYSFHLGFGHGIFQLKDCHFNAKIEKIYSGAKELDISNFESSIKKVFSELKLENEFTNITGTKDIRKMKINSKRLQLQGEFQLSECRLEVEEAFIGNPNDKTMIEMLDYGDNILINTRKLTLNNCTIIQNNSKEITIDTGEISGKNWTIQSKGEVSINGVTYKKCCDQNYLILTDKDLIKETGLVQTRANWISVLKALKVQLNQTISQQTDHYSQITLQQIEDQKNLLVELQKQYTTQKKHITKSLTQKSIGHFCQPKK